MEEDAISLNSLDSLEDVLKPTEKKDDNYKNISYLSVETCEKNIKHVRSLSDVTDLHTDPLSEPLEKEIKNGNAVKNETKPPKKVELKSGDYTLSVRFIETGVKRQRCGRGIKNPDAYKT